MSELHYTTARCIACDETKHVTEFYTSGPYNGKYYLRKKCKKCSNLAAAERNRTSTSRQEYLREYYDKNAEDIRQKSRDWRQNNLEYVRKVNREDARKRKVADPVLEKRRARGYALRRKYGISLEQYEDILRKQNDCCAICQKHKDEFKINLAVDHNHETGEIRGALCTYCNHRVIGRHKDGNLLRRMADYVEQGTGLFVPKKKRPVKRNPRTR